MRLVELGSLAVHQDRLHRAAIPLLHELHRATGLVVHLAVLDGTDVVYLEKIGDRMAAAIPTRVGGRQPAHCTAVGKAILAYSADADGVDLATRKTQVLDHARQPSWPPNWRRCARTASRSSARSRARIRLRRRADRRLRAKPSPRSRCAGR